MRAIAPRNGTLDRNTVSGWNSRADISGNARHFCDGEFNSKDTREILHCAKDLGVGIATRIIIRSFKTILYSVLVVLTHPQESQ